MAFQVLIEHKPNTLGLDDHIWALEGGQGGRVEIWPARGFNAYRWRTPKGHELVYADPQFFEGSKSTRSGIPILFPFPNRIRDGRFTWEGKDYQLPLNDPSGKNAIHGFVHNRPWRVIDQGANEEQAWVTGEFQGSVDAPEIKNLWPADYRLQIKYVLSPAGLLAYCEVANPGIGNLPWGLGFHPYLRLEPFGGERGAMLLSHPAQRWELVDSLPTGRLMRLQASEQFAGSGNLAGRELDDLFTAFHTTEAEGIRVTTLGILASPANLLMFMGGHGDFREGVLFIPPHRQAFCVEPYTCPTDAINLTNQGIECGLKVLAPLEQWSSAFHWNVMGS